MFHNWELVSAGHEDGGGRRGEGADQGKGYDLGAVMAPKFLWDDGHIRMQGISLPAESVQRLWHTRVAPQKGRRTG